MLKNGYLLSKIGADTAETSEILPKIGNHLPNGRRRRRPRDPLAGPEGRVDGRRLRHLGCKETGLGIFFANTMPLSQILTKFWPTIAVKKKQLSTLQ